MNTTTEPLLKEIDLGIADQFAQAVIDALAESLTSEDERVAAEGLTILAKTYLELRKGTSAPTPDKATDRIAELRSELHKTRIERDQARLEILPPGWYWDTAPGEVRARNIDGITFCAPPVGPQLRAIGVIPPAVQMGVGLRATRLAVKPEPERWGVLLDECEGGEQFATREAALEYGQETAVHEFWVGPLQRARASNASCDLDDVEEVLNERAGDNQWSWVDDSVFDARPGAQELLDVALDAMFSSGYWTVDTSDTNRHTVDTKPAEPAEADDAVNPPVCSGIGTVSVS